MEKLANSVKSEIFDVVRHYPLKDLWLCSIVDIESLGEAITPTSPHFGLFLALDALSLDVERIRRVAQELLQKGLVFLCAWGPDCERVHDIFDEIAIEMDPKQDKAVVMTTWHSDESLQEAAWFFINSAFLDEAYARTCQNWIFAAIGHSDWEKVIRESQSSG
jgi:hypothetical protein